MIRKLVRLLLLWIIIAPSACNSILPPNASFKAEQDPNVPGKIIITNKSKNAASYLWTFDNKTYSEETPVLYAGNNGNHLIELAVMNDLGTEDIQQVSVSITNIPSKLTVKSIKVTGFSSQNSSGESWDTDGNPDIMILACESCLFGQLLNPELGKYVAEVSEADLPIVYELEQKEAYVFEDFSPQTKDFYLSVVDLDDRLAGSYFYEIMSSFQFNPYHYTHFYDIEEDNYPSVLSLKNELVEIEIDLLWE